MIKYLKVFVSLKRNLCFASKKIKTFSLEFMLTKKKKSNIPMLKISLYPVLNTAAKGSKFAFCHSTQIPATAEKTNSTFVNTELKISSSLPQGFTLQGFFNRVKKAGAAQGLAIEFMFASRESFTMSLGSDVRKGYGTSLLCSPTAPGLCLQ